MRNQLIADYKINGFVNIVISAGNGRSITGKRDTDQFTGLEAVAYWKKRTDDRRCWVIALGTNDMISINKDARIKKMKAALGNDKAMWVGVSANSRTRPSYNGLNAFAWNHLLIKNDVNVYDWSADVKPSWFAPDGIHYTTNGLLNRSSLITNAARSVFTVPH